MQYKDQGSPGIAQKVILADSLWYSVIMMLDSSIYLSFDLSVNRRDEWTVREGMIILMDL